MKTAVHELLGAIKPIEKVYLEMINATDSKPLRDILESGLAGFSIALLNINEYLEIEKNQIKSAYKAGITISLSEASKDAEAEVYFNDTFKDK